MQTAKFLECLQCTLTFNILSCQNYFSPGVWEVHIHVMLIEILEGWRGIFVFKKWKFQGGGVVGVWIFSGTTQYGLYYWSLPCSNTQV